MDTLKALQEVKNIRNTIERNQSGYFYYPDGIEALMCAEAALGKLSRTSAPAVPEGNLRVTLVHTDKKGTEIGLTRELKCHPFNIYLIEEEVNGITHSFLKGLEDK